MGWILVIVWMFSAQPLQIFDDVRVYRVYQTELECHTARIYFIDKVGMGLASCYDLGANQLPKWPVEGYEMRQEGKDWLERNVE